MKIKTDFKLFSITMLLISLVIFGCNKKSAAEADKPEEKDKIIVGNPIYQADPSIFYHEDTYYLYGTNDENADEGFLVYTSKDMEIWALKGTALRKGAAYGDWGFWAPHVWTHGGKFYMAYTANEKITIAESASPLGPFKQTVKTPVASAFGQIDPFIFIDDDDKKYLYHVRLGGGNKIWVAELSDDFSTIKTNTYSECITATPGTWEHVNSASGRVAEGPTVIKTGGVYYLFYSANDFRNQNYAVGYAVSNSVYGPWTRYSGNPILSKANTKQSGSGHGDIVKGKNNDFFYVFHTHNSPTVVVPRKTAIVKLKLAADGMGNNVFSIEDNFKYLQFK